jgi:TolB protein
LRVRQRVDPAITCRQPVTMNANELMKRRLINLLLTPLAALFCAGTLRSAESLGLFEGQAEAGKPSKAGSVAFDPATQAYVVAGGGANMWATNDDFHIVWKWLSGNVSLAADIEGLGTASGDAHRKACLIIRQSLSPDSAYVDVAVHGSGLTSLQWREQAGGQTHEVQSSVGGPARVGLERQGDVFFMTLAPKSGRLENSGAYTRVKLADPVYVGLAVCAHDDKALEKARFSKVELVPKQTHSSAKPVLHCTLETIPVRARDRRAIYHTVDHIEAPNWSRDGQSFIFNANGRLYRLRVGGGEPELLDTGFANRCNNDHGLSRDGARLAISDQSHDGKSLIYVLPAAGGAPQQITTTGPSYWHGWSPDGSTMAFCGERNGEFDIYTIPAEGGEEKRLTTAKGLDDGPDYTADGKFIYFNSERTGTMQIWRMRPDGSQQEQVTSDDFNNWFPHPSPDGKWLVFLSYEKGVVGHPANQTVRLRLMPLAGGRIEEMAKFFGGQGTINVPSWSPDSQKVAYVTYELLSP